MPDRVVLAYSGGLDTSVAVRWLIENEGVEVVASGPPTVDVVVGAGRYDFTVSPDCPGPGGTGPPAPSRISR